MKRKPGAAAIDEGSSGQHAAAQSWGAPLFVFALALGVRALYLAELVGSPLLEALVGDARLFDEWARAILAGDRGTREVFFQAPLYPYWMAAIYALSGADPFHVRIAQSVLGSLGCALLVVAGRHFLSAGAGFGAGLVLALHPPALFFDGLIQKASLALFLSCALLALIGLQRQASGAAGRRATGLALGMGVVLGLLGLTRENALVLLPVLAAWLWLGFPSHTRRTRSAWLAALCFGVTLSLAPVGLRNLAVGGEFLLTTSNYGSNFYIGNNPKADGHYRPLRAGRGSFEHEREDSIEGARQAGGDDPGAGAASRYWLERGLDYVREQPGDWLALLGRKLAMILNAREYADSEAMEAYQDESRLLDFTARWLHFGVLFPLAVLGMVLSARRWRELWVLHLALLALAGSIALFFVLARFRLPMAPMLALFAAAGLVALPGVIAERKYGRLLAAGALASAAAVLCLWPIPDFGNPRSTTYANVGSFLNTQGRHAQALEMLERAAASGPQTLGLRMSRAAALAGVGRPEDAALLYQEILAELPGHLGARARLAAVLADLGRLEEAVEAARLVLYAKPAGLRAYAARFTEFPAQIDLAGNRALAAVDREKGQVEARLHLALWLAIRGHVQMALRECDVALQAAPDHGLARSVRADLLWWTEQGGSRLTLP